mmetsp:Transcript_13779/g.47692  ORF Transcript_13779/g.47692 Transcript_13779/m.47692 type:complete len:206 (+) Transcript_13779:599-1216(+)
MHPVRSKRPQILHSIWAEIGNVMKRRENDGLAILIPSGHSDICIRSALNVLDVFNAESTSKNECCDLVGVGLHFPPAVHIYGAGWWVKFHVGDFLLPFPFLLSICIILLQNLLEGDSSAMPHLGRLRHRNVCRSRRRLHVLLLAGNVLVDDRHHPSEDFLAAQFLVHLLAFWSHGSHMATNLHLLCANFASSHEEGGSALEFYGA